MNEQRKRFEAWAVAPPREWCIEKQPNSPSSAWPGQYVAHYVQCAWEAWQAACPEDWQSVPVELIEDQIDAGCEATGECEQLGECHHDCDCSVAPKIYRAMLSAAPKPEDVCKSPG
ncbi:hypothetical protein AWR38_01290 [Idiomarina sp. WRN-38]|nr:hypothetical protein AUR68_01285 [Idiomarina sp. H105]OAE96059.1 hypothetical protein AWR38_01290 [Idiomarina sp. WRN-38]